MIKRIVMKTKLHFLIAALFTLISCEGFADISDGYATITVRNNSNSTVSLYYYQPSTAYKNLSKGGTSPYGEIPWGESDTFQFAAVDTNLPPTSQSVSVAPDPYSPTVQYERKSDHKLLCKFFFALSKTSDTTCYADVRKASDVDTDPNCYICGTPTYDPKTNSCNITFSITNSTTGC